MTQRAAAPTTAALGDPMIGDPMIGKPIRTPASGAALRTLYLESLGLVERLHRRLLDVVKDEFERQGRSDLTAVQAILLFNIGDGELTAGELKSRGYYQGSNVSYNLKKLVDLGFVSHRRSRTDKRTVRVALTREGHKVAAIVSGLYERHIGSVEKVGGIDADEFEQLNRVMQRLDRFWNDQIVYRL